jgi:hypothetical protein
MRPEILNYRLNVLHKRDLTLDVEYSSTLGQRTRDKTEDFGHMAIVLVRTRSEIFDFVRGLQSGY